MKPYLLILALLPLSALRAQSYEKNILGVRAGVEFAYVHASGDTSGNTSARVGYRFGVSDAVLLHRSLPLYLETGVVFSSRGCRLDGVSYRPMYLQVPLSVSYHIRVGRRMTIEPHAGVYYGVGIGGKARDAGGWSDIFGERGMLRRSDAGLRAGVGVVWRRLFFGVGFDRGLSNLLAPGSESLSAGDEGRYYGFSRLEGNSFTLSVGCNF